MQNTTLLALCTNAALLALAASLIFIVATQFGLRPKSRSQKLVFGLILGVVSVIVVNAPVPGPMGATFDTRAAPIVLAGVFAGPLGSLLAAAIGAAARYNVGGPAAIGGAASFLFYAAAGIIFARLNKGRIVTQFGPLRFAGLSLLATLAVLPSFFIGQSFERGFTILSQFLHVLAVGNLVGIVVLGCLLEQMLSVVSERDRRKLADQTETLARQVAAVGVWKYDYRADRVEMDAVFHQIMGTSPDQSDLSIDSHRKLIHRDDLDRLDEAFRQAREGRTRVKVRYRILRPSGELRNVLIFADFLYGDTGRPEYAVGVAIDVTDEERLRTELALKSQAIESATCGIVVAEADGDNPIVYANTHFYGMTGYSGPEVLGRNCRFLNTGLEQDAARARIRAALKGDEPCELTIRNRRKDGSEFWNRLRVSPIFGARGRVTHFIGIQQDITEHVEANMAVVETRDQLRAILASALDAILTIDADGRVTMFNVAAERLFGWQRDEILGRQFRTLLPIDIHLLGAMAGHNESINAVRRDGSNFPARFSLSRYEHLGRPGFVAIVHDMTEITAVNMERTQLTERLTEQLRIAKEASDAKTRFLANMSHELRTPLNAILGFSDLILKLGVGRVGEGRVESYLSDIYRSGSHLLELVNDVLDLARIESGAFPMQIEMHKVSEIVERGIDIVRPIADSRNIDLSIEVSDILHVLCDRRAMQQCLLNLLSNAIKFSKSNNPVMISARREQAQIRIAITDRGPGISPAILQNIGRPFLRASDPDVATGEGTGLGLAITRQLVEGQGGSLSIETEVGRGTSVAIILPDGRHAAEAARLT